MKKIFFLRLLLVIVISGFFVSAGFAQTADTNAKASAVTKKSQKELQADAKTYCDKPIHRLYIDYNTKSVKAESQADKSSTDKVDNLGFLVNSSVKVLGYWFEAIDGALPKNLAEEKIFEIAQNESHKQLFTELQKDKISESDKFICLNLEYAPDSYKDNKGGILSKYACRQNLQTLIKYGCDESMATIQTKSFNKRKEALKADSDKKYDAFKDFAEAIKGFEKIDLKDLSAAIRESTKGEENKNKKVKELLALWDNYKIDREAIDKFLNDEKTGLTVKIEKEKKERENKNNGVTEEEKVEKNRQFSGEYAFDLAQSHYETMGNSIKSFEDFLDTVKNSDKDKKVQEAFSAKTKDLKKSIEIANELVSEQRKKIAASDKEFDLERNKLSYKQRYIESRINQLSFSTISEGVSSFNVSNVLVAKNNGNGDVSKEGKWSLFNGDDESNENFFDKIIKLVTGIVGTLGVVILIIAIVMLVTANGDDTQIGKAKELILYALGGLFVIFVSYIVIQFVIDLLVW